MAADDPERDVAGEQAFRRHLVGEDNLVTVKSEMAIADKWPACRAANPVSVNKMFGVGKDL